MPPTLSHRRHNKTTTTTHLRGLSMQARTRKQRSADQLLARTSHPVLITTPPILKKDSKRQEEPHNDFGSSDVLEQLKRKVKAKSGDKSAPVNSDDIAVRLAQQQQKRQVLQKSEKKQQEQHDFNDLRDSFQQSKANPFFDFDCDPTDNTASSHSPFGFNNNETSASTNKLRNRLGGTSSPPQAATLHKFKPSPQANMAVGFGESLNDNTNQSSLFSKKQQQQPSQATSLFANKPTHTHHDLGDDHDAFDFQSDNTVQPLSQKKKSVKKLQKIEVINDSEEQMSSEIDEEAYAAIEAERRQDDEEFRLELEAYYAQHPEHRQVAAKSRLLSSLPTYDLNEKSSKKKKHGEASEDASEFQQSEDDSLNEFSGDDDDYSAIGKPLSKQRKKSMFDISEGSEDTEDNLFNRSFEEESTENEIDIGEDGMSNYITIKGVRVPLRGITKEQAEQLLQEDKEDQSGSEDEREYVQSLGFTPEELDADKPNRIDYYKLPTADQIPLIDTRKLDFSSFEQPSVLKWDAVWPEHTSICDLSLRACILGTPNAGKSVIVNNVTRSRVTAVSAKRNTTRRRVLGVSTQGTAQLTIYDTPGINEIHDAKRFQRDLATEAWDTVGDADLALVVLDAAKRIGGPELFLLHKCSETKLNAPNIRWVLVLNKVDIVEPKDRLLDILYRVQTLMPFDDCFMVSGMDGDGMADLEHYLYSNAVPRQWEHSAETKTDQSDVQLAQELIRETLFHRLNQEIPYTIQQETVEWQPLQNGQLRIDQRLIVRRDQHKRILIGSNGNALNSITKAAEQRLQIAFRRPVSLHLRVSVSVTQDFESTYHV